MRATILAGVVLLAVPCGNWAADAPCDRTCFNGFVDQYLAALVAHDPSKLPLTKTARYTKTGRRSSWAMACGARSSRMGTYKLYFADPKAGQAGFYGTLEEHGHPAILGPRLKIENRKISEMETIIIRSTSRGSFSSPQELKDQPLLNATVAPADRNTRDEMVTIANSYFEGLEKATDKYTPFDKKCKRIENGQVTSNDPNSKNPITRMSCGEQFATGFSKIITKVEDRRFPIVDEERGLVYSVIRFDHNGRNKTTVWNDGSIHPVNTPFDVPFAFEIGELFKITNGKIQQIEALVLNVPYGMPTGWGK
jgi:hypothetical protein